MASMFLVRIISCFLVLLPLGSLEFICPGPYYPPNGFSYARIESNVSGRANVEYAKIRIKLSYDASIEGKPYQGLVQEATDFFTNALSVKPVDGRLYKRRDCESLNKPYYKRSDVSGRREKYCLGSCSNTTKCDELEIPKEHLDGCKYCTQDGRSCLENKPEPGTGVNNADLVFYVAAINSRTCLSGPTLAHAGYCDLDPVSDRPVFAIINICPTLAASNSIEKKTMLTTIKHEMMHALGFQYNQFFNFRDKEGQHFWPRDKDGQPLPYDQIEKQEVMLLIPREWDVRGWKINSTRLFLITPSVRREAQKHFGCSELMGAELEESGGGGSAKSHFEARVFHDDAMKSNMDIGKPVISRLDFAVLEDSGWYQVNYSQAEDMEFGRGLGCDFCNRSCKFWMDKKREEGESLDPYCDTPDFMNKTHFFCNGTKIVFSGCPLTSYHPYQLHPEYQHFDQISGVNDSFVPTFGSFDGFPDYCPVLLENFDATSRVGNAFQCEKEPTPAITPNSTSPQNPVWESNLTRGPNSTLEPLEPNSTWKPKPTMTLNPTTSPNPVEEAKDDEDETNECSHLGSSILLVILFALMVIML